MCIQISKDTDKSVFRYLKTLKSLYSDIQRHWKVYIQVSKDTEKSESGMQVTCQIGSIIWQVSIKSKISKVFTKSFGTSINPFFEVWTMYMYYKSKFHASWHKPLVIINAMMSTDWKIGIMVGSYNFNFQLFLFSQINKLVHEVQK